MTTEAKIITIKAACAACIGFTAPLITGLAQWVNDGANPPGIVWIVVIAGCVGGAAAQLSSFLSTAYSNFKAQQQPDAPNVPVVPVVPAAPPKAP